jgi:broad specificity phosphatase PhoE
VAWADHLDPGLHEDGRDQAAAVADALAGQLTALPVWSSPRQRTRETAAPLAARWSTPVVVAPAFDEIPSPSTDPQERHDWLSSALVSRWTDLGPAIGEWRSRLLGAVRDASEDVVVFTHFVAINAVVGAAEGRPEVVVFAPAYTSVTAVDVDPATGDLVIAARGSEATPEVG